MINKIIFYIMVIAFCVDFYYKKIDFKYCIISVNNIKNKCELIYVFVTNVSVIYGLVFLLEYASHTS